MCCQVSCLGLIVIFASETQEEAFKLKIAKIFSYFDLKMIFSG
jgi:hypothetical protein